MPWMIGVDEAGYGPNLGPLVVAATLWETPGEPSSCDPWALLRDVVSPTPPSAKDDRLHVADSKQVYSTARGLAGLERGVLAALGVLRREPANLGELVRELTARDATDPRQRPPHGGRLAGDRPRSHNRGDRTLFSLDDLSEPGASLSHDTKSRDSDASFSDAAADPVEPWFVDLDEAVPVATERGEVDELAARLSRSGDASGFRLKAVAADVVFTPRFNRLVAACGNKSTALSRTAFGLVRSLWAAAGSSPGLVLADKHGGRNSYGELLREIADGAEVVVLDESRASSRYRVGQLGDVEIRLEVGAERHLPTALASMTAKYVREICMNQFNRWWLARRPDLRPTKGYPEDAKRFHADIATDVHDLSIAERIYWRSR